MRQSFVLDSVVVLSLLLLIGFGLAAAFPRIEWLPTLTWLVAAWALALILLGGWLRGDTGAASGSDESPPGD